MDVQIQGTSVALHRRHGPSDDLLSRLERPAPAPFAGIQVPLGVNELPLVMAEHLLDEDVDRSGEEPGIPRQVQPHLPREAQDPLPDGNLGEDPVHEIGRRVGHPPAHAGRTEPATFAGEGDDLVMPAIRTAHPGEAVGQNSAVEIALELLPDISRQSFATAPEGRNLQEGRQVLLDHLVEDRLLRTPSPVRLDFHGPRSANDVPSGFRGPTAGRPNSALPYPAVVHARQGRLTILPSRAALS
jgi:hypothetical protein